MANLVKTFTGEDDFSAMIAAERFLKAAGFSVGSTQRGDPRGIMFGEYDISKWRDLNQSERKSLHGQMTGNMRSGPVTVTIFGSASAEAKREFHKTATAMQAA